MSEDDRPKAIFFGKVFNRKKDPFDERKVISLDKSRKLQDGQWENIKATAIEYEDGSKLTLPKHLTLKPNTGNGTQIYNMYFLPPRDEDGPFG